MTPELRDAMGGAAVEAARSINYRGAARSNFCWMLAANFISSK